MKASKVASRLEGSLLASSSVQHMLRQIESDNTLAAADHILVRRNKQDTARVIQELNGELPEFIKTNKGLERQIFTALIRLGLNLAGFDAYVAGIAPQTAQESLGTLREGLASLEKAYDGPAQEAASKYIQGMATVNAGDSLPGYMAEKIRGKLRDDVRPSTFLDAFASIARQTVYWKMVSEGYCKFGNDYARGLEILRHLGFSQVSTNPVLAAKAFDEDPDLLAQLRDEVLKNPAWKKIPARYGHEIAMEGTLLALWPNLEVFRPLAVLVENRDYMISFQLNPNIANSELASIEDAKRAYALAKEHLAAYDQSLGLTEPGRMAPNIVFKVAGSSPAARQITRDLNASGIGTNNTVTFSVGQEVQLIIDSLEGKAKAIKSGRQITRSYETNMGGRFVSHLRETEAERIFSEIARIRGEQETTRILENLAKQLKFPDDNMEKLRQENDLRKKTALVCSYRYLKSLTHPGFIEAASQAGINQSQLEQLESDLRKAGTLVARRVYWIFFEERNHETWAHWLEKEFGIQGNDAELVLNSVDILPASKRIPEDTYDTLANANLCNTEFPNHAKAVQLFSEQEGFDISSFRQAILRSGAQDVVERLSKIPDFIMGYELNEALGAKLTQVGLKSAAEEFGLRGLTEADWQNFGPVRKTMSEFKEAYDKFLERCVKLAESTG